MDNVVQKLRSSVVLACHPGVRLWRRCSSRCLPKKVGNEWLFKKIVPRYGGYLLAALLLHPPAADAMTPDPSNEEQLTFRLLLGNLDGAENASVLHNDAHRYTVALSGSSPVAWGNRIDANMEIWVTERAYPAPPTLPATDNLSLTLKAEALTYGLRLHSNGALRPYGLLALGFQATHLRLIESGSGTVVLKEDSLEPAAHVGFGLEWQWGNDLFSLDWRRWYAKGDFSAFGARDMQLGGDYLGLGLGHRW